MALPFIHFNFFNQNDLKVIVTDHEKLIDNNYKSSYPVMWLGLFSNPTCLAIM